jgi:hypothetical protein
MDPVQTLPPIFYTFILISPPHLPLSLLSGLFPSGFPTKTSYALTYSPRFLHAPPLSYTLILLSQLYLAMSTNHGTAYHVIFSPRSWQFILSRSKYSSRLPYRTTKTQSVFTTSDFRCPDCLQFKQILIKNPSYQNHEFLSVLRNFPSWLIWTNWLVKCSLLISSCVLTPVSMPVPSLLPSKQMAVKQKLGSASYSYRLHSI